MGQVDDGIKYNSKAPEDECKVMWFDHFTKVKPHNIQTALEEEKKELLDDNNELIDQGLLFEEENNDIIFFLGDY